MPAAARLADPIGHSYAMNGLLAGLLAGAAIAVIGVAVIGTGGLAAVALVGAGAAAGAGLGEVMSTMSWAPKEVVGAIAAAGAFKVFTNSRAAARAHLDHAICSKHGDPAIIATGSATVFINGVPAARVDDKTICSAVITEGSANVFIGGGTVATDDIYPENLVPGWVHATLLVVGFGAAVVLAGPVIAVGGLVGGIAGGMGGNWVGGMAFGEGSDGQKWSAIGGSLLGGLFGARGTVRAYNAMRLPQQKVNLQAAVAAEYQRLLASGIAPKRLGPALAGVMDRKTGLVYFGRNAPGPQLPKVLAPRMREAINNMPKDVLDSYIKTHGAGSHAEIYALNDAMLARPGAKPQDFLLYVVNAGGKASSRGMPIPRCPHCAHLTEGTQYFPKGLNYGD
jgi:uncharacterized Zn-binding protein involved in type VI secretion